MKLDRWERDHYERELRTADLVKLCYKLRCSGNRLTPEKLYALCQLTWYYEVHWQTTKLPALWTLWDKRGNRPYVDKPIELKSYGFPPNVVHLTENGTGIVNFYRAYRNSSLTWIKRYFDRVAQLLHRAARLKSNNDAMDIAKAIQELPRIPTPNKQRKIAPSSLLTPLFACLDPRLRFPIVAKHDDVVKLHRKLGIAGFSLPDQFSTLIHLIGQFEIKDALMLDVCSGQLSKKYSLKPTSIPRQQIKKAYQPLDKKDDNDVEFILKTRSRKAVRLHNSMTNRLTAMCHRMKYNLFEGIEPDKYDALIKNYDNKGRDIMIEVKSSVERPHLRLAVGQLLDYRRSLPRRAVTDLAVLLPKKPDNESMRFLDDVGVQVLWFADSKLKTIKGNVRLKV